MWPFTFSDGARKYPLHPIGSKSSMPRDCIAPRHLHHPPQLSFALSPRWSTSSLALPLTLKMFLALSTSCMPWINLNHSCSHSTLAFRFRCRETIPKAIHYNIPLPRYPTPLAASISLSSPSLLLQSRLPLPCVLPCHPLCCFSLFAAPTRSLSYIITIRLFK